MKRTCDSLWPRRRLALALMVILFFRFGGGAQGQVIDSVRPCLREIATQLARFLNGRQLDAVDVGAFTASDATNGTLMPGIQDCLIEELKKQHIRADADATMKLRGEYASELDNDAVVFRLTARLANSQGREVKVFERAHRVANREEIPVLLQVSQIDPGDGYSPEKRVEDADRQLKKPTIDIRETEIRAGPRRPYAMEILSANGDDYRAVAPTNESGAAFVQLKREQLYGIRLINDSDLDAAVQLTIDGLSMFRFAENKAYSHVVLSKHSRFLVHGWFISLQKTDKFKLTSYPESSAYKLNNTSGMGAITASFAASWNPNEMAPDDERSTPKPLMDSGFGRGPTIDVPFVEVRRVCGRVRDVVTVRYRSEPISGRKAD